MKNKHNRKRAGWLEGLLISTIVMLTAFIVFFIFFNGDSKFQRTAVTSANASEGSTPTINETNSVKYPGVRILSEVVNDDSLRYHINYPQTKFDAVNNKILQYITTSKENYINSLRLKNNVDVKAKGNLLIDYDIYEYKNKYYSIVFTEKVSLDSIVYNTSTETFFINKETGEIIAPINLLNKKVENLNLLAKHVRTQLSEDKKYKQYIFQNELIAATRPYWDNFSRFAIIGDSLVFYYDKGEIAARNVGNPTLSIPLSYINPILTDELKSGTTSEINILTPKKPVKSSNGKKVALTFDDGPHPSVTKQILKTLAKYDAKATFFMVGSNVSNYPTIAKEVYNSGHEIGNHTWNHANLTRLSSKQIASQLDRTNNAIFNAIGEYPTVFRPPYGAKNNQVVKASAVPVVMWTIDTLDWKYRNSNKLLPMVKSNMHNNAIILMHDIHQTTASGLDSVLNYLDQSGYEFVTVSEILEARK
ncbi:peptidoglycan/xylan/chitin deacetylase (PgdA/CDA1 family) [Lysinibacillus composti]|uniref:DUF3298 domain-containing protein n=1 Tax=Lysinibacillus composti TaxID=720633 RepID=A0A3N9U4T0_9BACI|nr:polysaccharide deacetylase family protein [Lysinibacillus composti]MBM7610514.1 peptidoglycan/xylan/chitin deacetylase (PgdA/CDA1 family) [Lysinibacillus composti]RQW71614.1 DUF3298 domain-containing protein [Lysinibacillus composti]